jgi:hypothetical protein
MMNLFHGFDLFPPGYSKEVSKISQTPTAFKSLGTVSELMKLNDSQWKERSTSILNEKMAKYCDECIPPGRTSTSAGFLEKFDLDPHSEVIVIGDIHGDLLRLQQTLLMLQQKGHLDENFHCMPGKHIVFLGDYVDRGENSLAVLELIMTLKLENKDQLSLIRGNHEDLATSEGHLDDYAANDKKYLKYMNNSENREQLNKFYNALPLSVCIAQKSDEKKEYFYFTHGLFHLYTDPAPLLDNKNPISHLWLEKTTDFSSRVKALNNKNEKMKKELETIQRLAKSMKPDFNDIYWLDVGLKYSYNPDLGRVSLPPDMIKAYLRISGTETSKIKEIVRGHQGDVMILTDSKQKELVTTLDPSNMREEQYILELKIAEKVNDWERTLRSFPLIRR